MKHAQGRGLGRGSRTPWLLMNLCLGALVPLSSCASDGPTWEFTEVTLDAGVAYEHVGGHTIYFMGGGVAAGDYDGDGWVDLFALTGDNGPSLLFQNQGDGTFQTRANTAGLDFEDAAASGPLFVDLDGDGNLDLLIGGLDFAPTRVFRNRGDGTFEDRTLTSGLPGFARTYGSAFGDIDGDGDLDGFLGQWNNVPSDLLWRNVGDFQFESATDTLSKEAHESLVWSFTPNFTDLDDDGDVDLVVACDFNNSQVLRNDGGQFVRITDDSVLVDQNGMGAAVGDYDRDGVLDWFVTSIRAQGSESLGNRLYRGVGNGEFVDVTDTAGVSVGFWGWGACFADFNNDGWLDIFHTNGFRHDPFEDDPSRLFINQQDGTFLEDAEGHGLLDQNQGRGVVCFDYDRDGDVDVFVANNTGPSSLYRNDGGNARHYLQVALRSAAPNHRAVGARIAVQDAVGEQIREVRAGNNFVSQNPARVHFGLGDSLAAVTVRVRWPGGGAESVLAGVQVDQELTVASSQVFSDTLERGDLAAWSATVP